MWWLLWLTIGLVIGLVIGSLFAVNINSKKSTKYIRRGILSRGYSVTQSGVKTGEFSVQFEVGEVERTDKKSKLEVISLVANNSSNNDEDSLKKVKKLINDTWLESTEIEWIYENADDIRDKKLEKILN